MSRREDIENAAVRVNTTACESMTITHTFELLTPIFGGAAVSRKSVDADNPIRVSAIRGQLRFWWRAARGGQFNTIGQLRVREAEIWGEGTVPGMVSLSLISQASRLADEQYFEQNHNGQWQAIGGKADLAYLGFSLQPTQDEVSKGGRARPATRVGGRQTLEARLSKAATEADRAEVEAAVWAWSRFGGIGGRTRRGFGAVSTLGELEPADALLSSNYIIDKKPPEGVPSLAPAAGASLSSVTRGAGDARACWERLANAYRDFRQGTNVGRNPPQPGAWAGRSRWPEPDVIRHATSQANSGDGRHQQRIVVFDKVPRAQFGLPIIFHFIENIDDLTLKPANLKRYASPLILRPVGSKTQAHGIALVLGNRPNLDDLDGGVVFAQGRQVFAVKVRLTAAEAGQMNGPLGADADPLLSFLRFVESKK